MKRKYLETKVKKSQLMFNITTKNQKKYIFDFNMYLFL
jgi:hypothetical protein